MNSKTTKAGLLRLIFAVGTLFLLNGFCKKSQKTPDVVNIKTFDKTNLVPAKQSAEATFTFPKEVEKVKKITMYVQDDCGNRNCDEWDRYANIYVKNKATDEWYEIARFITPYWWGTEGLKRGLEFDVTDFKSLLSEQVHLKIYTETWLPKGRTYSVDFDIDMREGEGDYKYSAVAPILQYNSSSHSLPYGIKHDKPLSKKISLPANTQRAHIRTLISGWGHALSKDAKSKKQEELNIADNYCAEWCPRTHHILIDNNVAFTHTLGSLNCAGNPLNNQWPGNWEPDRAGWCPGMPVPTRIDTLQENANTQPFQFTYQLQEWERDTTNGDPDKAFYAISNFIVVQSNTPITAPEVSP